MSIKVYTILPEPFRMGGKLESYIYTDIAEYERIDIGRGYFGILFQNTHTQYWHIALEDCGALIGTNKSRAKVINAIKKDVSDGDEEIMKVQIETGKRMLGLATFLERKEWFSKFRKDTK